MNNLFMTLDTESAQAAGGGTYVSEGGAYLGVFTEAKLCTASTGSKGIEFSFESKEGLKASYLNVYYEYSDKKPMKSGIALINALMAAMGLQQTTYAQSKDKDGNDCYIIPELQSKPVGIFLQKTLTSKQDGSDSYKFDIRMPFFSDTRQTIKEKAEGSQSKTIDALVSSYKDKDDRKKGQQSQQGSYSQAPSYPDDVPY